MQLVILAAGHGRRFGGLKQLAPVGPDGEALMDYTAADALSAGFDGVVLIVREDVRRELLDHIRSHWPSELEVRPVVQGPIAGTAQAVASAAEAAEGAFGVVNADDLYGSAAIDLLAGELTRIGGTTHANIGYRLKETILTDAPVTRGVCETSAGGELLRIVEQSVERRGEAFAATPLGDGAAPRLLSGDETVSMNLWGFAPSVFGELERALEDFDPETAPHPPGKPAELLLPSVVGDLVRAGKVTVRVREAAGRCIGITHPDDLPLVRGLVAADRRAG